MERLRAFFFPGAVRAEKAQEKLNTAFDQYMTKFATVDEATRKLVHRERGRAQRAIVEQERELDRRESH